MFADDKFHDECGVMGIWNVPEAANLAYLGLYAQQHRGQEGAGVTSQDSDRETPLFYSHKGLGLVGEVFGGFDFTKLPGKNGIGHVRYTTAGTNSLANVQPFTAELSCGPIAVSHNGNLVNAEDIRHSLIEQGAIFSTTSDTEIFLHLFARGTRMDHVVETVIDSLAKVKGAFSLLVLLRDRLLAVRDVNGFRPLVMGKLHDGVVFASETCAFDLIGAKYERDVLPGEIIEVSGDNQVRSYFPFGKSKKISPCIFEYVYFARPDSDVFGRNVYEVRKRMGEELAKESPVENADFVIPVPDSGITSALGYAHYCKVPIELGLIRNHYVGRTFIEPKQSIRDFGVKLKLNPNPRILKGKKIVVVDDSIVRGTTSRKLVGVLREAGASEVHMRISAPPTTNPCFYGIDTPDKKELIASKMNISEVAKYIGVDTLGYLSIEGLYRAVGEDRGNFCDACFSGDYPVLIPRRKKRQVELFENP
jgi:amidophosphoribosyltransferase